MIDLAESLLQEREKYTIETANALGNAVNTANNVLANEGRTKQQVTDACQAIAKAIEGLQIRGNKAVLKPSIHKATNVIINSEQYSAKSLAGLKEALQSAQIVYNDIDVLRAEVNEAAANLAQELSQVRILGDINNDQQKC